MELQAEIKKELRDSFTWGEQVSNILSSIAWLAGAWLWMTTVMLGALTVLIFITWEPGVELTFAELQSGYRYLLIFVGGIAAFVLLLFGLPNKLRNVFKDFAQDRIDRKKAVEEEVMSQIKTTEALLVKHGLVTKEQVEARKSDLSKDRLI